LPSENTRRACSPNNFRYEEINRTIGNGEIVAYAMYYWEPCEAAISAATSFLVSINSICSIINKHAIMKLYYNSIKLITNM